MRLGTQSKRFEDWIEIDCNECSHYWDSSCDAVDRGVKRPCSSFQATRSVIIPAKLERLQRSIKRLSLAVLLQGIAIIILGVCVIVSL